MQLKSDAQSVTQLAVVPLEADMNTDGPCEDTKAKA